MKNDKRTREQRKADASAHIAAGFLFLAVLFILAAVMTVNTTGQPYTGEPPVIADKLPGEDTPAQGCAYITEDPLYFPITAEDRATLEHIVEGEAGGESYEGKRWVATCLLNAMRESGMSAGDVRTAYRYAGWAGTVSDETIRAVSQVFDFGDAAHDTALWFYAPKWCSSPWHERQQFVAEIGGHRFFCPWEDGA